MYDSSAVARQLKRQDSVSYMTAAGEQNPVQLEETLRKEDVFSSNISKALVAGDVLDEYPPAQWCTLRRLNIAEQTSGEVAGRWAPLIQVKLRYTIGEAKNLVERFERGCPAISQVFLAGNGPELLGEDSQTFAECGVKPGAFVTVMYKDVEMDRVGINHLGRCSIVGKEMTMRRKGGPCGVRKGARACVCGRCVWGGGIFILLSNSED